MNVIHSGVTLVESRSAHTPGMSHVCVSLTADMTVHVMGEYNTLEPTVTFHVWNTLNQLEELTLTATEIIALVSQRGKRTGD